MTSMRDAWRYCALTGWLHEIEDACGTGGVLRHCLAQALLWLPMILGLLVRLPLQPSQSLEAANGRSRASHCSYRPPKQQLEPFSA